MSLRYRLHLVGLKSLGRNWKFPRHRVGLRLPGPNSKPRTLQPYRDALKSLGQSWKFLLAPGALKSLAVQVGTDFGKAMSAAITAHRRSNIGAITMLPRY